MEYIGEHLWIGKLGNFFIVLAFVAALLSSISYYFSAKQEPVSNDWRLIGKGFFVVHSIAILGIIFSMFYIIVNHYFEYQYAWQHSSKALPMRYMLSCFWEGQEGSFLLWAFWHAVLGLFLIRYEKAWEAPVMAVVASTQFFLMSMLLGVYVLGYKVGSNPFVLLREHPDYKNLPFVQIADYLKNLDGRGLNPLLQNYWMTIHPPILFLGFASTLIPFAFAVAGWWQKKYKEWIIAALPWAFFGVMILGTGILMGGAWAYEALSFGGFWAWDPVENASLVPWLIFVAAAHVMLINKNTGRSGLLAFILTALSFILILYSTFLTRSGILGNSSVHAFTDLGMSGQLLIYLLFYVALAILLIVFHFKKTQHISDEEKASSREFWMLIGSMILVLSSIQIIFTTSIPVINKVFDLKKAPPLNAVDYYNSWQAPFAVLITLLIAVSQYLKYKHTDKNVLIKKISLSLLVSAICSLVAAILLDMKQPMHYVLFFSSSFAIFANVDYFLRVLNGKVKHAGASIAHVGFGLIMLGALISMAQSDVISVNSSMTDISKLGKDFKNEENIMLSKRDTLLMGDYYVTYSGKRKEGVNIYYVIEYFKKDAAGKMVPQFVLNPLIQTNPRMGNVAEPDTRHFLHKDIYTHITYAEIEERDDTDTTYKTVKTSTIAVGDTIFASNSIVVFTGYNKEVDREKLGIENSDIALSAVLTAVDINNKKYTAEPIYLIRKNEVNTVESEIPELGLKFAFIKLNPENGKSDIVLMERNSNAREFVVLKAVVFPWINLLWLGAVFMIIGTVLSVRVRMRKTTTAV